MSENVLGEQLSAAQNAIHLPEVQEMVKRLAAYNRGVVMPHMHDAEGNMQPLPENTVQVEDDLQVSFHLRGQVVDTPDKTYLPVGWFWSTQSGSAQPVYHCPVVRQPDGNYKHTGERKTQ